MDIPTEELLLSFLFPILLGLIFGLICYRWAREKGRRKKLAFFMGFFFGIPAVIYYGLVGKSKIPCPLCKEMIQQEAKICRYCQNKIKD